jgi:hypothetical protein
METFPGGLAFACLITAQFFAVVAVHKARRESERHEPRTDARIGHIWRFGS